MADAYWRYSTGVPQQQQPPQHQQQQQQQQLQQQQLQQQAAAAAALPQSLSAKRPRTEYDVPSGPELGGYYGRDDERGMPRVVAPDPIEASYERYLRSSQLPSHVTGEPARSMSSGFSTHPIEDPRVMGIGGPDPMAVKSRNVGMVGGRPEISLPPDASNTVFVEGLPGDCTRREVSHIFRPFVGYREVRLVPKGSKHPGGDALILCFVDFATPLHAAAAIDALQGYKFDEHDRESANLRLQFARNPGARSGGRGKR